MPLKPQTIKRYLRELRKEVIESNDDQIAARVAQAMETAIRKVTEDGLIGWPNLPTEARFIADMIRSENHIDAI